MDLAILVSDAKRGCGKTTIATNLAALGLAILDVSPAWAAASRADWLPFLRAIEVAGR